MGVFENESDTPINRSPDQPLLRVKALAVMGGAGIEVRELGESHRQAEKRKRRERRELRQLKGDWDE